MIKPIGKYVVVKEIKREKKEGAFVVAEGARADEPLHGELTHDVGSLKKRDHVVFSAYGYTEIEDSDGEVYLVVPVELLLCNIS